MVTTAAKPSGIAATAKEIAIMNVFKMVSPVIPPFKPFRNKSTTKITTQIINTKIVRILLNWLSFFCKGVSPSLALDKASAIFPISVSIPVEMTTALARP